MGEVMVHTPTHKQRIMTLQSKHIQIIFVLSHDIKIKITNSKIIFLTYDVPLEGSNGHVISTPTNGLDA
jgi:hypothetical protein